MNLAQARSCDKLLWWRQWTFGSNALLRDSGITLSLAFILAIVKFISHVVPTDRSQSVRLCRSVAKRTGAWARGAKSGKHSPGWLTLRREIDLFWRLLPLPLWKNGALLLLPLDNSKIPVKNSIYIHDFQRWPFYSSALTRCSSGRTLK
jgi:hypothetical protein